MGHLDKKKQVQSEMMSDIIKSAVHKDPEEAENKIFPALVQGEAVKIALKGKLSYLYNGHEIR